MDHQFHLDHFNGVYVAEGRSEWPKSLFLGLLFQLVSQLRSVSMKADRERREEKKGWQWPEAAAFSFRQAHREAE